MTQLTRQWQIRPAEPQDAAEIAGVQLKTWYETYSSLLPRESMDIWTLEGQTRQWQENIAEKSVLVGTRDEAIVGFCCGNAAGRDEAPERQAELSMLYILSECQGIGMGGALFSQLLDTLAGEGFSSLETWVLDTNRRARYFYEHQGGLYFTRATVLFEGLTLQETGYLWPVIAPASKAFANDGADFAAPRDLAIKS